MESQTHTEVVRAPVQHCFDTIVSFESYPGWFKAISTASLVAADPAQGTWTVEYTLNMIVKTISYTLSYTSRGPNRLMWESVRGDIKQIRGVYELVELEPGLTEVTCTQSVDVGFWIPGPLKKAFEKTALVDSVREFKEAAEKPARSEP